MRKNFAEIMRDLISGMMNYKIIVWKPGKMKNKNIYLLIDLKTKFKVYIAFSTKTELKQKLIENPKQIISEFKIIASILMHIISSAIMMSIILSEKPCCKCTTNRYFLKN